MSSDRVPALSSDHFETRNPGTLYAWGMGLLAVIGRGAVLLAVLLGGTTPAVAVSYDFTIIDYPGAGGTLLEGINNSGQIVGSFFPTASTGFVGFVPVGFRYDAGTFSPVVPPDASHRVLAFGINDSGQVSGYYAAVGDRIQGFVYSNGNYSSVLIPGFGPGTLDPGRQTPAMAGINNSGQTVGNQSAGVPGTRAFVYSSGIFTPIQVPGPPSCPNCLPTVAWGINAKGEVSGYVLRADADIAGGTGFYSGFLYSQGVYTLIDVPGVLVEHRMGLGTQGRGLNGSGQIVGNTVEGFPSPGGGNIERGFVYSDGEFTLIEGPDPSFLEVTGINDRGQIVGWFFDHELGKGRGFLGEPVPEPATLLLFGTTAAGLGLAARWRQRRRAKQV